MKNITFRTLAKILSEQLNLGKTNILVGVTGTGKSTAIEYLRNLTSNAAEHYDVQADHSNELHNELINSINSSDKNFIIDGLFLSEANQDVFFETMAIHTSRKQRGILLSVQSLYDLPSFFLNSVENIYVISNLYPYQKGRVSFMAFNKGHVQEAFDYCDNLAFPSRTRASS